MPQEQGSAVLSLVGGLFLFALVLFLAWYCTRWLGGRYGFHGRGGTVQILERTPIGPDRSLMVVRAGDRVWLLGVTSHHIEAIGELDPQQYPAQASSVDVPQDFSAALQGAFKGRFGLRAQEKETHDE